MGIRVSVDSPAREEKDWCSIASDIATALGADDEQVVVTGVIMTDSDDYQMAVHIYAPRSAR